MHKDLEEEAEGAALPGRKSPEEGHGGGGDRPPEARRRWARSPGEGARQRLQELQDKLSCWPRTPRTARARTWRCQAAAESQKDDLCASG